MKDAKISEFEERKQKLNILKKAGIDAYPATVKKDHTIAEVLSDFSKLTKTNKSISVAGRIMSKRNHGNLIFMDLRDSSASIQIAISKKEIGVESFKILYKNIDIGDFLEIQGTCFITHNKENSIMAKKWQLLCKALRPLPDKWHGLKDEEEKLRKRYLDILMNTETRDIIYKKAKFWQAIRSFMQKNSFLEVETPVLEVTTGGADARPFVTHHNALDIDVFLRISMGELWQKRLMIAGLEKTFEIGRQFRNEGMDAEHSQDYTQMEFYWAYADYKMGMKLVEQLYKYTAKETFGTLKFNIRGFSIDLGKKWEIYDYRKIVKKITGIDILKTNIKEIEKKLNDLGIIYDKKGFNITRAIDNLWKHCRKQISGPGFLVGVPITISPLAKRDKKQPELAQRFQPIIAGSELGNGYSELNDPQDQAARFAEQQKLRDAGDDEAQMYDHEFIEALEYGMPPTCGFGVSERLFSFLADKSLRECQIFPLLKPKHTSSVSQPSISREDLPNLPTGEQTSDNDIGITYKQAQTLLDKYIKDDITKMHCLESEAIMRALAVYFNEDEEKWGIIGLLHDIDWDLTKNDIKNHTIKAVEILKNAHGSDFLIETITSHTWGNKDCGAHPDKNRSTLLQHALVASETLTGLIIATALVQPDKKLKSVKLSSLKKKFKQKSFAANCDRELIKEIEKTGLKLNEFLELSLKALQNISGKLGL